MMAAPRRRQKRHYQKPRYRGFGYASLLFVNKFGLTQSKESVERVGTDSEQCQIAFAYRIIVV